MLQIPGYIAIYLFLGFLLLAAVALISKETRLAWRSLEAACGVVVFVGLVALIAGLVS